MKIEARGSRATVVGCKDRVAGSKSSPAGSSGVASTRESRHEFVVFVRVTWLGRARLNESIVCR